MHHNQVLEEQAQLIGKQDLLKQEILLLPSGEGYFVDTSSGGVTVSLPAGSAGAIVAFADYARTFGNNTILTVSPNGSDKIGGSACR